MMPKAQKKAPGILDLLGLAVGQVGMSIAEFSGTTPDEFEAIAWFYAKAREEENEAAWERMRLLATITIQPHVKKKISPRSLLPLPWDKKRQRTQQKEAPQLSKEEQRQRFIELKERLK